MIRSATIRFATVIVFLAFATLSASVSTADDFAARFPELKLNLSPAPSSAPAGFVVVSAPAFAATRSTSRINSQFAAPVAFTAPSTVRPSASTATFSANSPLVGLSDDLRTALAPSSARYMDALRMSAASSEVTNSLIQPLAIPSIGGSGSSYFRASSAPFGAASVDQPVGFSYR
ncbi:MAG: hypothetical protein WD971_07775 [Pirellulales bacterium]